jgi:hypothetical protein
MSQSRHALDPALVDALTQEAQARLPAGESLTLEALEEAILGVFQDLGPAVAHQMVTPAPGPQKKGHRRSAAARPSDGSHGAPVDSSPGSAR